MVFDATVKGILLKGTKFRLRVLKLFSVSLAMFAWSIWRKLLSYFQKKCDYGGCATIVLELEKSHLLERRVMHLRSGSFYR